MLPKRNHGIFRILTSRKLSFEDPKLSSGSVLEHPQDVRHVRVGVWDIYQNLHSRGSIFANVPDSHSCITFLETLPSVSRFISEILSIGLWPIFIYMFYTLASSFIPTMSLYYSSELLKTVQSATVRENFSKSNLLYVAFAHTCCMILDRFVRVSMTYYRPVINQRIDAIFLQRVITAQVRLDLPTFGESKIQSRFKAATPEGATIASKTFETAMLVLSYTIRVSTAASLLLRMLEDQKDGLLLASLCLMRPVYTWCFVERYDWWNSAIAVICNNRNFYIMKGLRKLAEDITYRKDIFTCNLQAYISERYNAIRCQLEDKVFELEEAQKLAITGEILSLRNIIPDILLNVPQVFCALRVADTPISIPVSIASFTIINDYTTELYRLIELFAESLKKLVSCFGIIRDIYELTNIPNEVVDGEDRYPLNIPADSSEIGMRVEFRNVSFRYPSNENYALKQVSFKIEPGQLCVVVGANGEGKSSIMKLITRLYDACDGEVLLDDKNVRTYRLEDLRKSISVLYQDYTHFPLSIADNIGMGDPDNASDMTKIAEAAQLSGAMDFITELPEGMDTILDPAVRLYTQGPPLRVSSLMNKIQHPEMSLSTTDLNKKLSGGQMQRLALARTFMKPAERVRLHLYDEPSAALDPDAEYDLFQKLRQLRGKKTMIFSSHRFGHLTKHADLILFMKGGTVVEAGNHKELLAMKGHYARLYNIQARAFQ